MSKPEIAIRADGNSLIGLGHIHRMLAFAGYLKELFSIMFYCYKADKLVIELIESYGFRHTTLNESDYTSPAHFIGLLRGEEIIVLDGYEFKTEYQKELKAAGHRVIAIDDLNEWMNFADVVINHGYSNGKPVYKLATHSKLYNGLKYAIIKQEVLNSVNNIEKVKCNKVLVCIGGTDPLNYSEKIVSALLVNTAKQISLITYPLNPKFQFLKELAGKNSDRLHLFSSINTAQLIELIKENDFAILQPSNIALEAAAVGIGMFLIQTADNQKFILETLVSNHCAKEIKLENLINEINDTTTQKLNAQIERQHTLLDGKSPQRIIEIVNEIALRARRVTLDDAKTIYEWNNDAITRANSYNRNAIEYADHVKWFSEKVNNAACFFELFSFAEKLAGCVRIEAKAEENIIGITIAPDMRGKRLASPILRLACGNYFEQYPGESITAYIKNTNTLSLKSFVNAGFVITEENIFFGELSYKLIKQSDE